MQKFWDERYSEQGLAYGEDPNGYLRISLEAGKLIAKNASLKVLCLAEGQGRNALYLAKNGCNVHAVDFSEVAVRTICALAEQEHAAITAECADLATYDLRSASAEGWDLIVSVFAHTPPAIRQRVHGKIAAALKPGGRLVIIAYTPANIGRGTGGPADPNMCMTAESLQQELLNLVEEELEEVEEEVNEGKYHTGKAAVVRGIFRRPVE